MSTHFDSQDPLFDLEHLSATERALLDWADLIEADLDGEIAPEDQVKLHRALGLDADLRDAYETARASRELFASVSASPAPPSLREGVLAAIDAESARAADDPTSRPIPRRSPPPRPRREGLLQVAGVAAAVVALLVILLPGRLVPPASQETPSIAQIAAESGYSQDEVEEAVEDVKMAMAVLSRTVGQKTADVLRSEMQTEVGDRIQSPLREGLRRGVRSIPYLIPDAGNDQHSRILSPPRARPEVLEMATSLERTTT